MVTLTASGARVTKVALADSPLRSPAFDACVTKAFMGLSVPEATEPTTINVPFVFHSQ
jgi:hypothetical protein